MSWVGRAKLRFHLKRAARTASQSNMRRLKVAHTIDELKLLRAFGPKWFVWTGGPDQTEDPEWINDAIAWGLAVIENEGTPDVQMRVFGGEKSWVAKPGDIVLQLDRDSFFATSAENYLSDAQAALSTIEPELEAMREDAEKWRTLLSCERIRIMGRTMDYKHIGIEFWTKHRAAHPSEEFPQDECRAHLEEFVYRAALNKEGE
jgi:hypothetical protein